jgi:PncC family amidohydrolase
MSSGRRIEEIPLEQKIARILAHRNMTVTTAESCTGGLVAGTLVNADGVSAVFKEGYITYSNEAKSKLLGVREDTLAQYGAVSRETATEMAEGAAAAAGADVAISVTGIAGPGGGTPEKPVGLVYVGCSVRGKTVVKRCFFSGDRASVRHQTVREALALLYCQILDVEEQR